MSCPSPTSYDLSPEARTSLGMLMLQLPKTKELAEFLVPKTKEMAEFLVPEVVICALELTNSDDCRVALLEALAVDVMKVPLDKYNSFREHMVFTVRSLLALQGSVREEGGLEGMMWGCEGPSEVAVVKTALLDLVNAVRNGMVTKFLCSWWRIEASIKARKAEEEQKQKEKEEQEAFEFQFSREAMEERLRDEQDRYTDACVRMAEGQLDRDLDAHEKHEAERDAGFEPCDEDEDEEYGGGSDYEEDPYWAALR